MKVQKILSLLVVLCFVSGCFMLCGFKFFKKDKAQVKQESVQAYNYEKNDTWCITFQLVWNEFMQKFTNGNPVNFVGGNPPIADELNKKLYSKEDVSEDSYYIATGEISKKLKKQIEKAIKKKFNEKSDVLDFINWNVKDGFLFYSMLKKEFNFISAFDKLKSDSFNGSDSQVKYFGIKESSNNKLAKNVTVLFYNSADDYAVKLLTKENEDVILYRTDSKDSFEVLFNEIKQKSDFSEFTSKDILLIPQLNVDKTISYNELSGKQIKNTNYMISQALQTIKFKLDEKGGSLKSEAVISVMKTALMPEPVNPRFFLFNKPFVFFLIEQNKEKPYYAMKVEDTKYLVLEK